MRDNQVSRGGGYNDTLRNKGNKEKESFKIIDKYHIDSDDKLLVWKVKPKPKQNPKKKGQVTEDPEQELDVSKYMKARNARICRNKKRLCNLGLDESKSV